MTSRAGIGLLAGILLAIALTGVGDWESFVTALVFGAVGVVIGMVMDGRVDVGRYLNERSRTR